MKENKLSFRYSFVQVGIEIPATGANEADCYTYAIRLVYNLTMKKTLIISGLLVLTIVIAISVTSKTTEKVITNHPMIGKQFNAGDSVFYMEDCNNFDSCGDTPKNKKINRSLICGELNSTVTSIYNNNYQIPNETTFELIELLEIESHGLQIGGSNYVLAVLRDNNGLLSTQLYSFLGQLDNPFGFKNGNICNKKFR
jgi:hypothetical protein